MKKIIHLICFCILLSCNQTSKKQDSDMEFFKKQIEAKVLIYASSNLRGSGTYIDEHVLTNYHVVQQYDSTKSFLVFSHKDTLSFNIVLKDSINDLALLKPITKPLAIGLSFNEIIKRNNQPLLNEIFIGVGYPNGKLKSIVSCFMKTKNIETRKNLLSDKENRILKNAHTLLRRDSLNYHGASGTLMLSENACGVLTGVNDSIFALVNAEEIIYFLKKSGYF